MVRLWDFFWRSLKAGVIAPENSMGFKGNHTWKKNIPPRKPRSHWDWKMDSEGQLSKMRKIIQRWIGCL